MRGRRRPAGEGALVGAVLAASVPLLVAAVLVVRPTTAPPPSWAAPGAQPGAAVVVHAGQAPEPQSSGGTGPDTVLRRGGTSTVWLGQAVEDLARHGWARAGPEVDGCGELTGPADGDVRLRGWARGGRVVVVRVEAPATPGLLLPTAVRTGWSVEAVLAGSDGLLVSRTVPGASGEPVTVLTGRLPVHVWPPDSSPPAVGTDGRAVAVQPPPPAVDLVLGDEGTGRVVTAEVRVPAALGCPAEPGGG